MEEKVYYGRVIWFSAKKSIGFIARDDGKKDIFVHYSDIVMEGFKTLSTDQRVSFQEDTSFNSKLKAVKVTVLAKDANIDGNRR